MIKIFISMPMRGKTGEEIAAERARALESAKRRIGENLEVVNANFPIVTEPEPDDSRALWCLGGSLRTLAWADVAYFARGWENARGCRIEHTCAREYGIDTVIEDCRE